MAQVIATNPKRRRKKSSRKASRKRRSRKNPFAAIRGPRGFRVNPKKRRSGRRRTRRNPFGGILNKIVPGGFMKTAVPVVAGYLATKAGDYFNRTWTWKVGGEANSPKMEVVKDLAVLGTAIAIPMALRASRVIGADTAKLMTAGGIARAVNRALGGARGVMTSPPAIDTFAGHMLGNPDDLDADLGEYLLEDGSPSMDSSFDYDLGDDDDDIGDYVLADGGSVIDEGAF